MSQPALACPYCRSTAEPVDSPDHIVARSFGGGVEIDSCQSCNTLLNHRIDQAMLRDPALARLRAKAGLAPFTETYEANDGKVMQVEWGPGGVERARFVPKRIPRDGNVVDIFIDPDDWRTYHETQAERAAQRGEPYESYEGSPPGLPPPPAPGTTIDLLMRSRTRPPQVGMWPALAARIACGFIRRGFEVGFIPEEPEGTLGALGELARERTIDTRIWDVEQVALSPVKVLPAHSILGQIRPTEHLILIQETGSQTTMWLLLFGASLYELDLSAVPSPQGACWLLDATQRRFQEGTLLDLHRFLSFPVAEEQPQLFAI
jgi:hypothetical protein